MSEEPTSAVGLHSDVIAQLFSDVELPADEGSQGILDPSTGSVQVDVAPGNTEDVLRLPSREADGDETLLRRQRDTLA